MKRAHGTTKRLWLTWLCLLALFLQSASTPWLPGLATAADGEGFVLSLCTAEGPKEIVVPASDDRSRSVPRQHACWHCLVCTAFQPSPALTPVIVVLDLPAAWLRLGPSAGRDFLPVQVRREGFAARAPPLRSV